MNPLIAPPINERTKRIRNIKNTTFAIAAAPAAIPANPNNAAIIAIIKNVIAKRNIVLKFKLFKNESQYMAD